MRLQRFRVHQRAYLGQTRGQVWAIDELRGELLQLSAAADATDKLLRITHHHYILPGLIALRGKSQVGYRWLWFWRFASDPQGYRRLLLWLQYRRQ